MVRDFYFDKILLISFLSLVIIGLIFVFSATSVPSLISEKANAYFYVKREIIWITLGLFVMLGAYVVPINFWKRFAYPSVILSIILLILVLLFPAKVHSTDVKRWLDFGLLRFQPSEFAKFSLVLFFSYFVYLKDENQLQKTESMFAVLLITGLLAGLIIIEPHKGAAIFLTVLIFLLMLSSNFPIKKIITIPLIFTPIFAYFIINSGYAKERFIGLINPIEHRADTGYQAFQSILAFVKGGLLGEGIGNGTQKLRYIPEIHTDYIYALIGEETGFLGAVLVIVIFLIILFRGVKISLKKEDKFTQTLGIGLTYLIVLQALFHILVNVSLMPSTGFTLPFISYGGSSLLMMMVYAGILLRISKEPDKSPIFKGR
jgi:cell division protein FtsW